MKKTFKEYLKPADGAYTEGPMSLIMHQGILYKLDVLFAYTKDLPVTMLNVSDLRWQVENVQGDEARMKKADVNVPIIVHPQNGKYIVLDGTHRLLKAIKSGAKTIATKIVFEDVLAFARMGSGPDVAWASNVDDQNAYIGEAKTVVTPDNVAAAMPLVKFKKSGDKLAADFKYSEKKTEDNKKVEAQIKKAIAKFKLKRVSSDSRENNGYTNKGTTGEGTYEGSGIALTWKRSYSYSNGTTYHTITISPAKKQVTEGKKVKGGLTDTQLRRVLRAAQSGSRIIADGKTVWSGSDTTVFNSREAKEAWSRRGASFEEKMKQGTFSKVIIKDPGRRPGEWLTADEFDTSITNG